jgi:A/G-specific adenine glycosylase
LGGLDDNIVQNTMRVNRIENIFCAQENPEAMKMGKKSQSQAKSGNKSKLLAIKLLSWNHTGNQRKMPWKGEKDPYRIWLSEIILQQTRVEQGLKYYQNFISTFPDVHALANAPQEKVFKAWEGLGYYSRCRNLISSAKFISTELNGIFPKTYEAILQLKGVGSYTAAAIASFAYNLPYAVLDGNVFRVLSRIFDIEVPIDSSQGKKHFSDLAQKILPQQNAGEFNQAIMDFGAVICKPVPECSICFFNDHCEAYLSGKQEVLPVKEKKIKIKQRWFNYAVLQFKDEIAIRRRTTKDIWQELHEFVLMETDKEFTTTQLMNLLEKEFSVYTYKLLQSIKSKQKLTHQSIEFCILQFHLERKQAIPGFTWVKKNKLANYAFPKTLQRFIANELR